MAPTVVTRSASKNSTSTTAPTNKAPTKTTTLTKDAGVPAAGRKRRSPLSGSQNHRAPKKPIQQQPARSKVAVPETQVSDIDASSNDCFQSALAGPSNTNTAPQSDLPMRRKRAPFPLPSFARQRRRQATHLPPVYDAQRRTIDILNEQNRELRAKVDELGTFWIDACMEEEAEPRWKRSYFSWRKKAWELELRLMITYE